MSVNIANILHEGIASGAITVDIRKQRGWSPWHHHGAVNGDVTVVSPRSQAAFVSVLTACHTAGLSCAFLGGGTSTQKPSPRDVLIETSCLDALYIDENAQELVVGAGIYVDRAEAFVAEKGWTLGQWLGSGATSTIGGAIATNASGILSGRYGNLRDTFTAADVIDVDGNVRSVSRSEFFLLASPVIVSVRVPLWPSPDGRAVARFTGTSDPFVVMRHVATARLMPAHLSLDNHGVITVIVEGEPHLETARYQLIAAILQKHGAVQDTSLDQNRHWDSLLSTNPWSANAGGSHWADRIVVPSAWSTYRERLESWTDMARRAGGMLTWRATNPTTAGLELVIDLKIPYQGTEPDWIYTFGAL